MSGDDITVPLVRETASVGRRVRTTGKVRVRIAPEQRDETIDVTLTEERAEVRHVPVGRFVATAPAVRVEGDTTIVPVLEERAVVTVRLFLREELHIRGVRSTRTEQRTVSLRNETVEVQRIDLPEGDDPDE